MKQVELIIRVVTYVTVQAANETLAVEKLDKLRLPGAKVRIDDYEVISCSHNVTPHRISPD